MFKLDLVENYFRKNPIYFLDSIRYERQKEVAVKNEEAMTSERWIQFWAVVITILVIPFGVYLGRRHYMYSDDGMWMHVFELILIESVFVCSLMIAVIWEGFNSFSGDMESGVFEPLMTTLIEPSKIVWGKFLHVFIHFLKFSLVGFLVIFVFSPFTNINPALILVLFALNLAAGCFMISHRIYKSAREAYGKARAKYRANNDDGTKKKSDLPSSNKLFGFLEALSVYSILTVIFLQVQMILITNAFGDMSYYPRLIMNFIGQYPLAFVVYLFIPMVFLMLVLCYVIHKRTIKLLGEII